MRSTTKTKTKVEKVQNCNYEIILVFLKAHFLPQNEKTRRGLSDGSLVIRPNI